MEPAEFIGRPFAALARMIGRRIGHELRGFDVGESEAAHPDDALARQALELRPASVPLGDRQQPGPQPQKTGGGHPAAHAGRRAEAC